MSDIESAREAVIEAARTYKRNYFTHEDGNGAVADRQALFHAVTLLVMAEQATA